MYQNHCWFLIQGQPSAFLRLIYSLIQAKDPHTDLMFIDRTTIILFNFTEMTTLIIHIYVMLLCVRDSVKDLTHYLIECSQQFYEVDIIITCISQIKKK